MGDRLNKPYMEVEGNQTTGKTSIDAQTTGGTDRHLFIVVLGLWEASKTTKKILARSEKITYGSRPNIQILQTYNKIRKSVQHNMIRILWTYKKTKLNLNPTSISF